MSTPPSTSRPSLFAAVTAAGRALFHGLGHLLFPNSCRVCGAPLPPDGDAFCNRCRAALLAGDGAHCPRCAADVGPFVNLDGGCSRCRNEGFAFERVFRLGRYEGLLRDVVLRLKHHAGEGLAEAMGALWAAEAAPALRTWQPDVVISVPLHWRRRWHRGYNQSEALARALAQATGVPCRPAWLRRPRATPMQHHQPSPSARRENVRDAFHTRHGGAVKGRRVLLVDDVMTTGSTAHEAARPLRAAGATIAIAVLARAT